MFIENLNMPANGEPIGHVDAIDPLTGKGRRRWRSAGYERHEAERDPLRRKAPLLPGAREGRQQRAGHSSHGAQEEDEDGASEAAPPAGRRREADLESMRSAFDRARRMERQSTRRVTRDEDPSRSGRHFDFRGEDTRARRRATARPRRRGSLEREPPVLKDAREKRVARERLGAHRRGRRCDLPAGTHGHADARGRHGPAV